MSKEVEAKEEEEEEEAAADAAAVIRKIVTILINTAVKIEKGQQSYLVLVEWKVEWKASLLVVKLNDLSILRTKFHIYPEWRNRTDYCIDVLLKR